MKKNTKISIVQIKPSQLLLILLVTLHLIANIALWATNIQLLFKMIGQCFLILSCCNSIWRNEFSPQIITTLRFGFKKCQLITKLQQQIEANLLPNAFASSLLVILNFRILETKKKKSIIIFRDAVSEREFRYLKRIVISNY